MMSRICDNCDKVINGGQYIELGVRLMKTNENESQDNLESLHGDYCNDCLESGKALEDLLLGLENWKH
jgi:hypothetical protein